MPVGVIVLGVCMVAIGGVHTAWQFFLAAVIGRAISQPFLIGVVPRTMAVNFFNRRRNTALAFTGIYRPISGALIIQAFALITLLADWRTAFRILGFFSLFLAIPMFIIMRRRPEDIGLLPDGARPSSATGPTGAAATARGRPQETRGTTPAEVSWTSREAMRSKAFWMVSMVAFLNVTGSSGLGFSLVPYLHEFAGLTTPQAAGVLSVSTFLALSSLVGSSGGEADAALVHRGGHGCVGAGDPGPAGGQFAAGSVCLRDILGAVPQRAGGAAVHGAGRLLRAQLLRSHRRAMRPFEAGGLGLGQIVGPVVYDLTGSYTILILFSAAVQGMAMILMLLARRPERRPLAAEAA